MNEGTFKEEIAEHLLSVDHRHETIEAVCPNCGKHGDAVCPHCLHEYEPNCLVEDYGFRPGTNQEILARFASFVRFASEQRNMRFWLACFLIASGDSRADGVSMRDIGKDFKVGKACVSKTCVEICKRLQIPPSAAMRSEESKESFRESNRRNRRLIDSVSVVL